MAAAARAAGGVRDDRAPPARLPASATETATARCSVGVGARSRSQTPAAAPGSAPCRPAAAASGHPGHRRRRAARGVRGAFAARSRRGRDGAADARPKLGPRRRAERSLRQGINRPDWLARLADVMCGRRRGEQTLPTRWRWREQENKTREDHDFENAPNMQGFGQSTCSVHS